MTQNLANLTPVEIDTILAPIWERQAKQAARIAGFYKTFSGFTAQMEKILSGEEVKGIVTAADGIKLAQNRSHIQNVIARETEKLRLLETEALPYEAEYTRRGGWNRVFLATSSNGHAHNGMECSTCHHGEYRTGFAWLIQYSGKDEAEIVADAGERACTTCYPTAPANAKGTKMFTPDEEEAAKARAEREALRIERARQADVKGITTPEGLPLDIGTNNFKDIAKTLRTAEIAATDFLVSLLQEKQYAADPTLAWMYTKGITTEKRQAAHAHLVWWTIRAIAAKKGLTFEEVFQVHAKKAEAKMRKMARDWAKSPLNPNRTK